MPMQYDRSLCQAMDGHWQTVTQYVSKRGPWRIDSGYCVIE